MLLFRFFLSYAFVFIGILIPTKETQTYIWVVFSPAWSSGNYKYLFPECYKEHIAKQMN